MRIFVLEDSPERAKYFIERFADHEITITDDAKDAVVYLSEEVYDYIFLDHDLGDGNGSGADVAEFLSSDMCINDDAVVIIHSWNIPASAAMLRMLPGAFVFPYGSQQFQRLSICNRGS